MEPTSSGSTSTPAPSGTSSGGPPTVRGDDGAAPSHCFEDGLAERLDEAGLADDTRCGDVLGYPVVRHRADEPDARPLLERRPQGAFADEGERRRTVLQSLECVRESHDVLALRERADEEIRKRAVWCRCDREPLYVDTAVDDLGLPARFGHSCLELSTQVAGDGDHGGGAPADPTRRAADDGVRTRVGHVLPMRGDDERCPRRKGCDQTRRHEEVRVDDIWPEGARGRPGAPGQIEVPALPSGAPVDHRQLDLVTPVQQSALEPLHEDAEIRVLGPRVHLRDEEDPQTARPLATRDLHDAEAHLVRRPLAPEHVAWRRRDPVPAVMPPRRVVAARHS